MELSDLDSISMNADLSWNQRKIPGMNFVILDCKVYFVIQDSHCILQVASKTIHLSCSALLC